MYTGAEGSNLPPGAVASWFQGQEILDPLRLHRSAIPSLSRALASTLHVKQCACHLHLNISLALGFARPWFSVCRFRKRRSQCSGGQLSIGLAQQVRLGCCVKHGCYGYVKESSIPRPEFHAVCLAFADRYIAMPEHEDGASPAEFCRLHVGLSAACSIH